MSAPTAPGTWSAAVQVGRGVFIELLRRKDLYVLGMLMGLFAVVVLSLRTVGITEASTATFLLNLGMTLSVAAAHLLTLLMAVRQFPQELENRTLHPLLAKPVERSAVVIGKWGACTLGGLGTLALLLLLIWGTVPRMESFDGLMLAQVLLLQAASLGMLAALSIGLSLWINKPILVIALGTLLFLGGRLAPLLRHHLEGPGRDIALWLAAYLPNFSLLNGVTRYTDGVAPLAAGALLASLLYAVLFTAAGLAAGITALQRRRL